MKLLGELYATFDKLSKEGRDTIELEKAIEREENEVLKNDIIPQIKEIANILLSNFRKDVKLTINLHKEQKTEVRLEITKDYLNESRQTKKINEDSVKENMNDNDNLYESERNSVELNQQIDKKDNTHYISANLTSNEYNEIDGNYYCIKHHGNSSSLVNNKGWTVFSTSGKLKLIGKQLYRIYKTYSYIAINVIVKNETFDYKIGERIINATSRSQLYKKLCINNYLDYIQEIKTEKEKREFIVKFDGVWYNRQGFCI